MVRFARAEGSKGSNKRVFEEATPWKEMVPQSINELSSTNESSPKKKKKKKLADEGTALVDVTSEVKTKKKKKSKLNVENQDSKNTESPATEDRLEKEHEVESSISKKGEEEKVKKKRKRKKKNKEDVSQKQVKEYSINEEGERIKLFRDGTKRPFFDLPYEEGNRMTRYDNMWVKCDMVAKLNELKATLKEQNLDKKDVMRKMMKAKRKAHRDLRIELIYEQKRLVLAQKKNSGESKSELKNPKKQKKNKKKSKKITGKENSIDEITENNNHHKQLVSESGEVADFGKNMNSEKEVPEHPRTDNKNHVAVKDSERNTNITVNEDEKMDSCKETLEQEKEEWHTATKHMEHKNSGNTKNGSVMVSGSKIGTGNRIVFDENGEIESCHGRVKDENHDSQTEINQEWTGNSRNEDYFSNMEDKKYNFQNYKNVQKHEKGFNFQSQKKGPQFEENDMMTQYEGYWVMREAVDVLIAAKEEKLREIYSARTNGDDKKELSAEEELNFRRAMKKLKRFENAKLLQVLPKTGGNNSMNKAARSNSHEKKSKSDNSEFVRFDGFRVTREAADRLNKLKKRLLSEGTAKEELQMIMQRERRREENILKKEKSLVCLKCRKPGHMVSACPDIMDARGADSVTICYKCGSTEHMSRNCSLKQKGAQFTHATCYVCGETGHISRECPDNPRGLYPNGGACRACGSVEHFVKDCPDAQRENEELVIKLGRINKNDVEALDYGERASESKEDQSSPSKKMKVVNF